MNKEIIKLSVLTFLAGFFCKIYDDMNDNNLFNSAFLLKNKEYVNEFLKGMHYILLTYVYLPHYLYKLNKPSVCSLYLLPENYSDTTVFLNNNKDYGNYTLHHGLLTKSAQFLLNKKYNNVEWFTTITIILKPKLNSITLTINNNDFKLLHPKVLYDNIKDFKGRTINYNNNNEKNYIKVLKRIIKNLEYEQIINQ